MSWPYRARVFGSTILLVALGSLAGARSSAVAADDVETSLAKLGTTRGMFMVLGDSDGALALDLAWRSELTVFVQTPSAKEAAAVRKAVDAAGLLGTRIYVQQGEYSRLN